VEMIEHDVDGWLVPPGDVRALADGIVRLLNDGPRRDRYANHARQRVTAFDIQRLAERYLALYAETAAMSRAVEASA
jgi:glycosyltransferase involved in cell wall biosynthesis